MKHFIPPCSSFFSGIQIAPQSLLDEGIEPCLGFLQEVAAVNSLVLYPSVLYGVDTDKPKVVARTREGNQHVRRDRPFARNWFTWNPAFFTETALGAPTEVPGAEGIGRDLIAETAEAARRRGMKTYLRILEPCWGNGARDSIPNWTRVLSKDAFGNEQTLTSPGHPDYVHWILGIVRLTCSSYPVDGFKYGYERNSPISTTMSGASAGTGFDDHFCGLAERAGINAEKARRAFQELFGRVQEIMAEAKPPVEGSFTTLFRCLLKNPVLLEWDNLWYTTMEELPRRIHETLKSISPELESGRHIPHGPVLFDIFDRAHLDYAELAGYTDWIKPSVYPTISGPRLKQWWIDDGGARSLFGDLPPEERTRLTYRLNGYDPDREPAYNELSSTGLSAEAMEREVTRAVAATKGRSKVVAGVGFNIPWWSKGEDRTVENPELIQNSIKVSVRAGATGILLSREYDEMTLSSLEAAGCAIREAIK